MSKLVCDSKSVQWLRPSLFGGDICARCGRSGKAHELRFSKLLEVFLCPHCWSSREVLSVVDNEGWGLLELWAHGGEQCSR